MRSMRKGRLREASPRLFPVRYRSRKNPLFNEMSLAGPRLENKQNQGRPAQHRISLLPQFTLPKPNIPAVFDNYGPADVPSSTSCAEFKRPLITTRGAGYNTHHFSGAHHLRSKSSGGL